MQLPEHTLIATPQRSDDGRRMELTFSHDIRPIYWELLEETTLAEPAFAPALSADFALLAALPMALRRGQDLHIAGEVCPILMGHAENLVRFRVQLNPDETPRIIALSADRVHWRGGYDPDRPYLISLSGGVDSTQALDENARHGSRVPPSPLHRHLAAALLVRGFDYPDQPSAGFDHVSRLVQEQATRFGMDTVLVATNWKKVLSSQKGSWATGHILGLCTVHHLMAGRFGGGIFAANHNYANEYRKMAWGENGVVNAMLSSGDFHIETRGSWLLRSQKLAELHRHDRLADVSVCWAGPRTGRNCGECSKCHRTMMMMTGQDIPVRPLFPRTRRAWDVAKAPAYNSVEYHALKEIAACWSTDKARLLRFVLGAKIALAPLEMASYRVYRALRG